MKMIASTCSMLSAAALVLGSFVSPATAAPVSDITVDVSVTVTGNIEGVDAAGVEAACEELLKAAHVIVTDADGPNVLELHLTIAADDDGSGLAIHFEAGAEWKDDADCDSVAKLEEVLTAEIKEFVEAVDDDE